VAFVASISTVFGQYPTPPTSGTSAVPNTPADPVVCAEDAGPLNPVAGIPYDYSAFVNPSGDETNAGTAHWFVTTDIEFIINSSLKTASHETVGGDYVSAAIVDGTAVTTGNTLGTASSEGGGTEEELGITITWKSEGLSNVSYVTGDESPLFVGIMYEAPADACANNIQVWRIEPIIAFTLDITNVEFEPVSETFESKDYGVNVVQCFSDVVSAVYDYTANSGAGAVIMDYGKDSLYFEVIAANFSGSFDAYFELTGLETGQTADIYWGYSPNTATIAIATGVSGTWSMDTDPDTGDTPVTAITNETNTSVGVSIYVKVVVEHNGYEGLGDQTIALAVDGYDSAGNDDVKESGTVCIDADPYEKESSQTLTRRPTIDQEDPTPFEDKQ